MKLKHTRLCCDCETVHDGYVCPDCGSRAQFPIAAWLNREDQKKSLVDQAVEVIELERIFRLKEV